MPCVPEVQFFFPVGWITEVVPPGKIKIYTLPDYLLQRIAVTPNRTRTEEKEKQEQIDAHGH